MISDEKLKEYRHEILSKHNHLDILISSIICAHYFPNFPIPQGFFSNVLYQQPLSYSSRLNMLRKIYRERDIYNKKYFKKLKRMGEIRNSLAHSEMVIITKNGEEHIYNPKNFDKEIDFDEEYKEYIILEEEISKSLINVYENFGGILLHKKPKF